MARTCGSNRAAEWEKIHYKQPPQSTVSDFPLGSFRFFVPMVALFRFDKNQAQRITTQKAIDLPQCADIIWLQA
jgi:hypothetical protein